MITNKDFKFPVSLSKETFIDKIIADAMIGSSTEHNKKIRKSYGYRKNSSIHFERVELTPNDLLFSLSEGHVACNLFRDSETNIPLNSFTKSQKNNDNFEAAYVIFVDIDDTSFKTAHEFVSRLSLEPTFYYTSFSNMQGDKGLRFRIAYVFDKPVATNPYTYKYITHYLNDIIERDTDEDIEDKCNEKCSQYFNGTNINNSGVVYDSGISNKIYNISDLYCDNKEGFINGLIDFLVNYCCYKSFSAEKADKIKILLRRYTGLDYMFDPGTGKFTLSDGSTGLEYNPNKCSYALKYEIRDKGFSGFDSFMKHNRHKYKYIYRVERDEWINNTWQYTDDNYFALYYNVIRVKDHHNRRKKLYERACLRRLMKPDVDADTLLYCMYVDICRFFDHKSDNVLDLTFMVRNVETAMQQPIETIKEMYKDTITELKKKRPEIILKSGVAHGTAESKRIMKEIKWNIARSIYDHSKTKKENIKSIKEKTGIKFSEKTLQRIKNQEGGQIQRENVKNTRWTNTKGKCYFSEGGQIQRENVKNEDNILNNSELNQEGGQIQRENVIFQRVDKLNSMYVSLSDVDKEKEKEKKNEDNNDIKDKDKELIKNDSEISQKISKQEEIKDKEDMNTDIEEKYRWMIDVADFIEHDDVIQKYRRINLEKKQNTTDSSCGKDNKELTEENIIKDKEEDIIKNDSEISQQQVIPQQQKKSKQQELNELKDNLTLDGITSDFLGIHSYTKDLDVKMINMKTQDNQDNFEAMFINRESA